jgi:hypothetical protein
MMLGRPLDMNYAVLGMNRHFPHRLPRRVCDYLRGGPTAFLPYHIAMHVLILLARNIIYGDSESGQL